MFLAANLEGIAESADKAVAPNEKENFHMFLCTYTYMFTKNIHNTKDFTYHDLKGLIRNDDTVLVSGDNKSCVVVMRKTDYINKMQGMINDDIVNGLYKVAVEKTLTNLKHFKDFL